MSRSPPRAVSVRLTSDGISDRGWQTLIGNGANRSNWPRIRLMADSHGLLLDTDPEVRRLQIARWAESSPARKVEIVQALCRDARTLALAGIRLRFPDATPREQSLRLGALTIDRMLMIEAFGWDPEREGR